MTRRVIRGLRNVPRHWRARHARRSLVRYVRARPVVSFSFDDFPASAHSQGGAALAAHGIQATYYVSFGLLGRESPIGRIADERTVARVIAEGNEIGCHTFRHDDAWQVPPERFADSVEENARWLDRLFPGQRFETFAYPHGSATPAVKGIAESRFPCARGIYAGINDGWVDRNLLAAHAVTGADTASADYRRLVRAVDRVAAACGWLILYTHDVRERPSPFGCTPAVFRSLVAYVAGKGLDAAPVAAVARDALRTGTMGRDGTA